MVDGVKDEASPDVAGVRVVPVSTQGLLRIGARPGLAEYLRQIWRHRAFIVYDARARVSSGNRRDRLGSAWMILNPVLNGLTYYLIFGLLLNTSKGIENFIGYLIIGVFLFQLSARAITNGARSMQVNKAVIQAFNFPRATLPISVNVREILASVPVLITMLILVLLFPPTEDITWRWVLLIPALFLQSVFNLGVGLILARMISRINDITHLLGFGLRVWMYASAVFFSYERFIDHPRLLAIVELNPLFNVLDIVRDCVLYATLPSWESWAILSVWAFGMLALGIVFFWKGEESYGRE
ncbi:phosphate ABC transporter permease [Arthrobacter pityocampae]|uniref:Transport permease protein n=1 Tax=Arthrobacter pityocampae TaxID=547334 RepID=A0A2S5J165_9MICC|nr:phosphate ABC transporter permease [Arthrobacter pityocampae]